MPTEPTQPTTHEDIRNLASRNDVEAMDTLQKLTTASDQFLRRTALEIIGRHARGRELTASVLGALRDSSEYVRRTACAVVEQWKLVEAHDLLLPLLAEPAASTRESALRALSVIWDDADFQAVLEIYKKDPEISVRRQAASALRQQPHGENWRVLFADFFRDKLPRHRSWACELAGAHGESDILPLLAPLLDDRDGHVRRAAAHASQAIARRSQPSAN
ncbi:HEAT repeat domain-containing protein [Bradyrhizobium sp. CCBAU 051011]|uniref:HEAT repeat domain-containing protein n=1 Tax=Bradyrhizobium sp. CCBAU 051011 TaxID=858422 RepID=UPI00137B8844|nr:HEAT repeat domain-containing protein [Bradyrhizobium sp. CCBAU 051011]